MQGPSVSFDVNLALIFGFFCFAYYGFSQNAARGLKQKQKAKKSVRRSSLILLPKLEHYIVYFLSK